MIARLNVVSCRRGREDELERRLAQVTELTRGDPGCDDYRWLRSDQAGDETAYFNFSRWRTNDSWRRHLESEGFKAFAASEATDPCLSGTAQHHGLTEVGSPL